MTNTSFNYTLCIKLLQCTRQDPQVKFSFGKFLVLFSREFLVWQDYIKESWQDFSDWIQIFCELKVLNWIELNSTWLCNQKTWISLDHERSLVSIFLRKQIWETICLKMFGRITITTNSFAALRNICLKMVYKRRYLSLFDICHLMLILIYWLSISNSKIHFWDPEFVFTAL